MNAAVSIVLLAAVLGVIVFLLSRRENGRRSQYGPSGLSEFRTDRPLTNALTVWTSIRTRTSFCMSAAGKRTAGSFCT